MGNGATLGGSTGTFAQVTYSSGQTTATQYGYETVAGTGVATYTTGSGIGPTTTTATVAAGNNVALTTSTTISTSVSVNSLVLSGSGTILTINPGVVLTVASGGLLASGTITITGGGTLAFGTAQGYLTTGTGSTITDNANTAITGTGGLVLSGPGTVTLNQVNPALSGGTFLDGSTLILGGNNVLPGGTLTLTGGTLESASSTPVTVANAVALNNSSVTLGGAGNLNFVGPVTLSGLNDTLNVTNTGTTAFTGVIADLPTLAALALTKLGSGTLVLSGANTYSAQTNLLGGTTSLLNSYGLGLTPSSAPLDNSNLGSATSATQALSSSGTLVGPGATLQLLAGGLTVVESILLDGGTIENVTGTNVFDGAVAMSQALSTSNVIQIDAGQLTVNGAISGTADLSKTGGGTLVLNAPNTFTGELNVNTGIVALGGFGTGAGPNTVGALTGIINVANGATLQLAPGGATAYLGKNLSLSGTGLGLFSSTYLLGMGALASNVNLGDSWSGDIVLSNSDPASGADDTIDNAQNTLTITGAISGAGSLTKVGAGTLLLAAAETYYGATTVAAGTLTLNGVGQILDTSGVTLNQATTLNLDNNGGTYNITGRLQSPTGPANVNLNDATLAFVGNNTAYAQSTDTLGTLTLVGGASYVNQTSGSGTGASALLNVGTLARQAGAVVTFLPQGTTGINGNLNTPQSQILITNVPSLTDGILPWAFVGARATRPTSTTSPPSRPPAAPTAWLLSPTTRPRSLPPVPTTSCACFPAKR